jgi:hypothetical protein
METIFHNFLSYRDNLTWPNQSTTALTNFLHDKPFLYQNSTSLDEIKKNFKFSISKLELNIFYVEILLQ